LDNIAEVYNFTVANCLNYFVGKSSVLVHNDHGTGILGKLLSDVKYADLLSKLSKLDELQEGLGAKMGDFIEQWGSEAEIKKLLDKLRWAIVCTKRTKNSNTR
jgi:hypothetical protein